MIVLSEDYNINIPGFVYIKYNDELKNIVDYIKENMEISLDERLQVPIPI